MKEIGEFKPLFRDLSTEIVSVNKTYRKLKALEKWFIKNVPAGVKGEYAFSPDLGESCVRLFLYLDKDDEESTINVIKWLPKLKKQRFKIEKIWRERQGYFSYKAEREYKSYNCYIIFIESAANIDGCVIREVKREITVYETDCEPQERIL